MEQELEKQQKLAPRLLDSSSGSSESLKLSDLEDKKQYMLLCTGGIFIGKFLYINMTLEGEVFGSGDPERN